MKRLFMEGAGSAALMRRAIKKSQVCDHEALNGLSAEFREGAKWYGPETPADSEGMVVGMVRLPNDEPNPTEGTSLVFVDRRNHRGKPEEISLESMGQFWTASLDYIRAMPIEWYKAGAVIWDDLKFSVGSDWTAGMLGLRQADEATGRAYQAALVSAVTTNVGTTDLETVHVALATFIHAHPAFANVVDEAKWHLPYGDSTAYRLLRQS
ncbi:hypothetical protein [Bradyrhizobium erythrophlei]|uniref:Uncharacterized protein n=1 Tax=Bradyrhizobium erythrophlei TaxID=1437360 RepID=A0A1M5YP04_9BRAD|nr:hypothetical protein [Bradyrhizobium erythrophlei]SHI13584.1 hypothetical protein SAMN05443248_8562 [Bradyrhizobium erythrophlei]